MKVVTSYGNYAKGQIDHDMNGRFELPVYQSGMDIFANFISNYKGNAIFSAGFLSRVAFQDCAFVEYKFGITQDYLCAFIASAVQFLAFDTNGNFGWVIDPNTSAPLTVASPYTLADAKTISNKGSYTQNSDVMYLCHRSYAPYKLTRTSSTSFTLATYTRTADPFWGAVTDASITSNTIAAGSQTFTVSASEDYVVGASVVFTSGANFMSGTVTSYSGTTLVANITTTLGTGTFASWVVTQTANWPGACCFYQGRLYMASSLTFLTKAWWTNIALYDDFTIQNPITDASGFAFTCTDITQQIEWIFPADNSLVFGSTDGILAVNGGAVNTAITPSTVQTTLTSAEPTNGFYPFKRDGLLFYTGRRSRNLYYFRYDILTELFISKDANLAAYDITKGNLGKMRWTDDRYRLIFTTRGDGAIVSTIFDVAENINGWHSRKTQGLFADIAVMGDNLGNPQLFALTNRGGTFYIEQQAGYVEFPKLADFWTPSNDNDDLAQNEDMDEEAYLRYVAEQLRGCVYLDNASTFSDFRTSTITFTPTGTDPTYNEPSGTIVSNASDFSNGDVGKHIVYKTATGYESGRFIITAYTSGTTVSATVLQAPKQKEVTAGEDNPLNVWSAWYKSFSSISGMTQYIGTTVGINADGAFIGTQPVTGDTLSFGAQQITSIVVGYQYTGIIKSMSLGFVVQGTNTQVTQKEVNRFSVRCVNTLGLKVGTSLYGLQDVQERTQSDINYLPPAPIDGTKDVDCTDTSEEDKFFYIVQDQPLPANVTSFMVTANYASAA